MKFSTVILFSLFATHSSASPVRRRQLQSSTTPCLGSLTEFSFSADNCRGAARQVEEAFNLLSPACPHQFTREIRLLTQENTAAAARTKVGETCLEQQEAAEQSRQDNLSSLFPITVDGSCTYESVIAAVASTCACDAEEALMSMLSSSLANLKINVNSLCSAAWDQVNQNSWDDINGDFDGAFMRSYFGGGTILNTETSNMYTPNATRYPTSAQSAAYGASIENYFQNDLQRNVLGNVPSMESCQNNAMMCCFGRDRQSGDRNGQCRQRDCDDADPSDNSNLCAVPDEEEGDIHCHGVAWSEDPNDISAVFKYNNLFYVTLHDHLYMRGYVNAATDNVPMCGCVEDMPVVTRSDCTEVGGADISFELTYSEEQLSITAGELLGVDFDACRGLAYGTDERRGADNDLASYVHRLTREGKISEATETTVHSTIVGYESPNDNDNQAACTLAMSA